MVLQGARSTSWFNGPDACSCSPDQQETLLQVPGNPTVLACWAMAQTFKPACLLATEG